MIIGVPKEIKQNEARVGLVVAGVKTLIKAGHRVLIETNAGIGCGIIDNAYKEAGAEIVKSPREIFDSANMIVKVKEPIDRELEYLHENQILFTFLHLAAVPHVAKALIAKKVNAVAYETIQTPDNALPVLKPMSEIAGKLSSQVGAYFLQRDKEGCGKGLLLGGVPGVKRGRVIVIGGGVAGMNAAKIAVGMGAEVTVIDREVKRLEFLEDIFGTRVKTLMSNISNIEESVRQADLIIGSVLVPGGKAPKIITKQMIGEMEKGTVIVDISIDQGGCIETIRPTTHEDPTYEVQGVIHYGVTNIPAAVARTSTYALTNATFPYVIQLANKGLLGAVRENPSLYKGVNVYQGKITYKTVADDLGLSFQSLEF